MRVLILILVCCFSSLDISYADEAWKPSSKDQYDVADPRYKALASYRKALVLIRVYSFISDHQSEPGDAVDYLLTDFQEQIAAAGILDALSYLEDYPDDTVASKILEFQVDKTSGVWPPWKWLALALFDRCRKAFDKTFSTLSVEKQYKLIQDLEWALRMSETDGPLIYPMTIEKRQALGADIQKLKESPNQPAAQDAQKRARP